MAGNIVLFIYLFIMMIWDLKRREISLGITAIVAVILTARQLSAVFAGQVSLFLGFSGVLIGIVLMAVSIVSRGQIGVGDGILFVVSGMLLGLYENIVLLFLSLITASFVGVGLLILRKGSRKDKLPFAPFVFAGYGVICLCRIFV